MRSINRRDVASGIIWRFFERMGAQSVTFVVSIILARLLSPDDYGKIALVTGFTAIMQVFVDSGLGNALIQKKDSDEIDFSSVFYFNLAMSLGLYGILFVAAPLIASFYEMPDLVGIIRTLGLTVVFSGVKNIQQAYVTKNFLFKKFFISTFIGTAVSAVIGVYLAYNGYGIWALVLQQLLRSLLDMIILWGIVEWRPQKHISLERLKKLLAFGSRLLLSAIINRGYMEARTFIIGKLYLTEDLAFYDRGRQFPNIFVTNVDSAIDSVLLPTMSQVQEDIDRVKKMTRRAIKTSTYVMAPFMMGLAACATPLVRLLLTDKWLPSVFFLRIICFTSMFYAIHTANLNAIKAVGRSDLFLKLEIIKLLVGLLFLFSTVFISVKAMAIGGIFSSIMSQIINSWPNKKLLRYSYLDQLKDILPGIILAIVMSAIVFLIQYIGLPDILTLIIQVIVGIVVYILGSLLFHIDSFEYLLNMLKTYFHK